MTTRTTMNRPPKLWKRARATWVLVAINALWFLIVENKNGPSTLGLLKSGALDQFDVVNSHQWFRLISSMFVHLSFNHILINMISLSSLYVIELIMGVSPFVFAYLLSGILGNVLYLLISPANSVAAGASGAIFGIFGAALLFSFKGILTKAARNQLLVILALNLVYGFSSDNVANSAHIGGLLTGMGVAWLYLKYRPRRLVQWLTGVLIVVSLFALWQASFGLL